MISFYLIIIILTINNNDDNDECVIDNFMYTNCLNALGSVS